MKTAAEFILYVKDQQKSRDFYSAVLNMEPVLDVPGMTSFQLNESTRLGLMPEENIARILGASVPQPKTGNGIPRCEVYLMVEPPEAFFERAVQLGAIPLSPVSERDWGDKAGYCADADGHILAFAAKIKKA